MAIRTVPYSVYDVPAVEDWLERMSRKGLHFKKFTGAPWAEFHVGEPREYRYRLEPCRKKEGEPDRETVAAYHEAGWEYVTTRKDKTFHVWRSKRNAEPVELHTDPVVQSYGYDWLEKRVRRDAVVTVLVIVSAMLFILGAFRGHSVGTIISPGSGLLPQLLFAASMYSFFIYQALSDLAVMRRLLKSLRAGVPLARDRRPFPARKLAWYGYDAALLVYLVLIVLQPATQGMNWDGDPADYPVPIPFVSVEQLGREEQTEGWVAWDTSYLMECVTVVEGKGVRYSPREGWSSLYYPGRTQVYRMRLSFLADDLLAEMAEYQQNNRPLVEELQDDRFDGAWYAADGEEQTLILRRGDHILRFITRVPEDLREHLDLFWEAMEVEVHLPDAPECGEYHGIWR